jgi:hypothetical protein
MALPSIALPSFKMTIPSTGQEVEYRPFLVKEEKILLIALEGKDKGEITQAIYKILEACIEDKVDFKKLPTFDIEYMFLMLRSKSVGEEITFTMSHAEDDECRHRTEVKLNINDVKVDGDILDGTLMLTDTIGIQMHYPTIEAVEQLDNNEAVLSVIASCIDLVFDEDDVYDDFTHAELIEWLGNLNASQFEEINKFFSNTPKLKHTIEWTCSECGKKDKVEIEGLYNFFI